MSLPRGASSFLLGCGAVAVTCLAYWIVTASPPERATHHNASPATLKKINEDDLGVITLSEEGERRLGVELAAVERQSVRRVRIYGGEVVVPAGRSILVSAPLPGTLRAPEGGVPPAGRQVTKGEPILWLLPLLSPETSTTLAAARADAEGQVRNAQTQLTASKLALDRARRLLRDEAGSKRAVEESQAQHDVMQRTLEAAESRLAILTKATGSAATGRAEPIPLEAPETGVLRNVSALAGQNVPGGAALFEVIDLKEVWVRVPIYVGDSRDIDPGEEAEIGDLNMQPGDPTRIASRIEAPPSASAATATIDLYFTLENDQPALTPGQRVGVKLPLSSRGASLTVPWSAVVQDHAGGMWVYEATGPNSYRRQRVLVRYVVEKLAVLAAGPPAGTKIVTAGAVELFAAETGFIK